MDCTPYFKSIIDQDTCSVVICNTQHEIVYMNPAAAAAYKKYGGEKLTGSSILDCHNAESRKKLLDVTAWFAQSAGNNRVHTFYNDKQSKDVYMIALRDESGRLIGYYEKHEYRAQDTSPCYELN